MNPSLRKGVDHIGVSAVMFCHDGEGLVFLNKRGSNCRDEQGKWDLCGGSVDFDDTIETTIGKEIQEEYGATPLDTEFLGFRDVFRINDAGEKTHWVTYDFKVRIDPREAKNNEPHKFDAVGWFPIDRMPAPVHSEIPRFMRRYQNRLY